ncbi:MAG TPA: hypothetical protein VLX44_08640 [Xanthobacteraceae bacterium]|nr:hypothetical protein [Xanthobacteraceae bacterium]
MPVAGDAPPVPDDEDEDSCICGMEHLEDEVTADEELPPSTGGIEAAEDEPSRNDDDVDGCGLDFTAIEQTGDEELPEAVGGT